MVTLHHNQRARQTKVWFRFETNVERLDLTDHLRIRGEITIILRFERRVCRWESCRMHQFYAALAQLPEALRSERRGWGWKSLTRHHFAHVVQCRDGALKTRTVSVQVRPWAPVAVQPRVAQCRGVPLKPERLQVQVLPRGPAFALRASTRQAILECQPDERAGPRC